jgi:histidinol-phosphate/aromatic aminotransferase/cobyric acid decarboxylase-like protein
MSRLHAATNWRSIGVIREYPIVRLNEIRHPYGPCPAALESLQNPPQASRELLATQLRSRLAAVFRVPTEAIHFLGDRERTLKTLLDAVHGPLVSFPPSAVASLVEQWRPRRECIMVWRGAGGHAALSVNDVMDIPSDAVAIIDSPSDPLGTLLSHVDAVRLARACRFLIIDERCAEFNGRSLVPLALEFENVAIVRSFEIWAGLADAPIAWTVMSPRARVSFEATRQLPDGGNGAAALATLDELPAVNATLRILREERSRLYRLIRKLSFLEPVPSWGPFLTARVTIGRREDVVKALHSHGVEVHSPNQIGLERYIRFGIGSRTEMDRLRQALHASAPSLLACDSG